MYKHTTQIRVRYGEVDQMGYLYYGNYGLYYEVARAEMIRNYGYTYSEMEIDGTIMPVVKMTAKYLQPAKYDELLTLKTEMEVIRNIFVTFHHKIYNEQDVLINIGEVTLVFFDPKTQKKTSMPERMKTSLDKYINHE
jgi:acyl-CoA thioester hydrolase